MNGIINVLKPKGMTSHDVVAFLRRLLKTKKIGHTGTLDPGVTGVLPICIGRATKIAQYLTDQDKEYIGELTLGATTTTQDGYGELVIQKDASHLGKEEVLQTMTSFIGPIEQIPPMVSAVRHKGKRLYELAREGIEVERQPRRVTIFQLEVLETGEWPESNPKIKFHVTCSKGTYVRTLCADIGERLGVGGYMSHLVRSRSGPFRLEEAVSFEELEKAVAAGTVLQYLQPIEAGIPQLPRVVVKPGVEKSVQHGNRVYSPGVLTVPEGLKTGDILQLHNSAGILAIAKVVEVETKIDQSCSIAFQPITVF